MFDPFVLYFKFQNFLRNQNNKNNYNLVCETLQFLDCICGSTTGGLGLLGLYINEKNVGLINQTVESLTEYCQGPCHENQVIHSWQFRMRYICTKLPNCKSFICISNCSQLIILLNPHTGVIITTSYSYICLSWW